MKTLISALVLLSSTHAFASGTLSCVAEDGSKLEASVASDPGSVPTGFRIQMRSGALKAYPNAVASYYETKKSYVDGAASAETIQLLVVTDPTAGILAVVKEGNILIDRTGTYSADCEFGY